MSEGHTQTAFITGVSSGLGYGLARVLLEQGWQVFGISRRAAPEDLHSHVAFAWQGLDLAQQDQIVSKLAAFLPASQTLSLVILNAGVLGDIQSMQESALADLKKTMDINMWANKEILDALLENHALTNVLAISSGAAVNGNFGWSGYSLSKAALNMLIQLYAAEVPESHFISLAPGLIHTAMQDHIYEKVDRQRFSSMQRLVEARGSADMPGPYQAAQKIISVLGRLRDYPSGSFLDIRTI